MTGTPWTAEEEDVIRAGWRDGVSSADIGKKIGRTSSAVRSKAEWMGLGRKVIQPPKIEGKTGQDLARARGAHRGAFVVHKPRVEPGANYRKARPLEGTTFKTCQWIAGEPMDPRCGKPVRLGESYCKQHAKRVYRPRPSCSML